MTDGGTLFTLRMWHIRFLGWPDIFKRGLHLHWNSKWLVMKVKAEDIDGKLQRCLLPTKISQTAATRQSIMRQQLSNEALFSHLLPVFQKFH